MLPAFIRLTFGGVFSDMETTPTSVNAGFSCAFATPSVITGFSSGSSCSIEAKIDRKNNPGMGGCVLATSGRGMEQGAQPCTFYTT